MSDDLQSWFDDTRDGLGAKRGGRDFADVVRRAAEVSDFDVTEESLTGFLVDSREAMDRRVETAPRTATFVDMLQRAHALSPELVDGAKLLEAQRLAPVVDLHRRREDSGLDRFVREARGGVEASVRRRQEAPIGPGPVPATVRSASKRWIGAAVLAAAGLLGVAYFAAPQVFTPSVEPDGEQALLIEDRTELPSDSVVERESAPPKPVVREKHSAPLPAPEEVEAEMEGDPESEVPRARPRVPVAKIDLGALAEEAERQWRAGELATAERTLRKIVSRGGRTRQAENAFSDLFALAHRRGDAAARKRWWRSYLDRFPRGRFADDARAGLCRMAAEGKRAACWTQYLARHPSGSYRAEAKRATQE